MEKLGIDLKLILVQIVNFFLLLFILKKALFQPILSQLKKRREEQADVEKIKENILKEKKALETEEKRLLSQAKKEKEEILTNAKREAETEKKKIIEKANQEAKEILQGTRKQIERDQRIKKTIT